MKLTVPVLAMACAMFAGCSTKSDEAPATDEGSGGSGAGGKAAPGAGGSGGSHDALAPATDSAPIVADAQPEGSDAAGADVAAIADASAADAATKPVLTGTVKIMVLGSSNETGTCWRAFLWQMLRAAGVTSFDFVGRTTTGPDCGVAGYDKDLEGMPGTIITGFSANDFAVRFKANPPHMVLVHVGGADARDGVAIPRILAAYTLMVQQARAVNPNVIFLVGAHTPQKPMTGILELNAAIPPWAMQISTPDSPVAGVDLFTGIVPATDQSDGTHLNAAGSQKVAAWFLAPMLPFLKP